ncbi:hypothetical protein Salat_1388600 [Sesamum alatum]|uniref:Uncharacterized protein n=1 Tax=Sesamum alatum TaxID=300844 RepID=A0AAE2CL61_9LAMI|nr:hypothetical protein Salat_1388600 [Sesamum alatum]
MALLASCWLIVESFIIPHGLFLKCFYLSFYIHPIFLLFSQIFLWFLQFYHCLLSISCYLFPYRILNRLAILLLSFTRPTAADVFYDAMDQEIPAQECEISTWNSTCSLYRVSETRPQSGAVELGNDFKVCRSFDTEETDHGRGPKSSWLDEYLSSDHYSYSLFCKAGLVSSAETVLCDHDNSVSSHGSFRDQSDDFDLQDSDKDSTYDCLQSHQDMISVNQEYFIAELDQDLSNLFVKQQLMIDRSVREDDTDPLHQSTQKDSDSLMFSTKKDYMD